MPASTGDILQLLKNGKKEYSEIKKELNIRKKSENTLQDTLQSLEKTER